MNTPPKLSFACPMPWSTMSGTERQKFCAQCGCHVTNLSLLTAAERKALLERAQTERVCGSYYLRLSGEMVTPDAPLTVRERAGIRQFGVTALSVAALALATGCVAPAKKSAALDQPPVQVSTEPAKPVCPPAEPAPAGEDEVIVLSGGMWGGAEPEDPQNHGYMTKSISNP